MDLDWLKYFCAIAETGCMRQAAGKLFVSEPAISKAMKKLEKELGVPLIERKGRGIALTVQGDHYYREISTILRQIDALNRSLPELSDNAGVIKETLVLEIGSFARQHLDIFLGVREKHTDIQIEIQSSESLYARPKAFDLAVVPRPFDDERFDGIPLYDLELGIVSNKNMVLSENGYIDLIDIRNIPFIQPKGSDNAKFGNRDFNREIEAFCIYAGFKPKVIEWTTNLDAVVTLLRSNRAVSMVPLELYYERFSDQLRLYRIREPKCSRKIWLIWKKGRVFSEAASCIIDDIEKEFAKASESGQQE